MPSRRWGLFLIRTINEIFCTLFAKLPNTKIRHFSKQRILYIQFSVIVKMVFIVKQGCFNSAHRTPP